MLAPEFPPKNSAGVHRTLRFCRFLPEFGISPVVITTNIAQAGGENLLKHVSDSVSVHRFGPEHTVSTSKPKQNTTAIRQSNPIKSLLRPAWQFLTETPDRDIAWAKSVRAPACKLVKECGIQVIYSSGPPHSVHIAAMHVSQKTGVPWVADFRDPWARKPWAKKQNPWGQRLLPYYEHRVVKCASKVILNTEPAKQNFCKQYPTLAEKFVCIPNGLDPDLIGRVGQLERTQHSSEGAVICHPGSMYGRRDPNLILDAISKLNDRGSKFELQQVGAVAEDFDPMQHAQSLGISHLFRAIPPMAHDAVLGIMKNSDILLIIQPDAPLMVPGKVYEMLAFDIPMVAVCDSEATAQVVLDAGGYTAASQDVDGIAVALEHAWADRDCLERIECRERARTKYDGRELSKRLAEIFSALVQR